MKTLPRSSVVSCLLGCVLALSAQAGTLTETFSSTNNFLTNGVKGTIWDGVYLGVPGEFARTGVGGAQSTYSVANSGQTTNGALAVASTQSDWENGADDGFFLYKVVSGDFDASVQIVQPIDAGNWNTFGLQARVFGIGGAPIQPTNNAVSENYVTFARFPAANNNRNYIDNVTNGADSESAWGPNGNTNYWLRMERVGDNFNIYEKATAAEAWTMLTTIVRADFAGRPLQVGIMQAEFAGGGTTARAARFDDFSLTAAGVGGTAPSAVSALTITTNAQNDLNLAWTAGAGSDGAVVVVWTGTNIIKQAPADGFEYATKPYGQGDALPGTSYYVVYSGSAPSTTVSNLAGQTYNFAVYAYAGSGTARTYNRTPATARVASPAQVTSLVLSAPSSAVAGSARNMKATAFYNNGANFDVTTTATYTSSASNIVTNQAPGRYAALTNGNASIVATFQGSSSTQAVSVVSLARTHRWSFNEAPGATTFVDSDGSANGSLTNVTGLSGGNGAQLSLSGQGDYVQLPPDLLTNYGAVSIEAWATDAIGVSGARIASFGNDGTHFIALSALAGAVGPRGAINTGAGAVNITGVNVPAGAEHHYIYAINGAARTAKLYVDGLLVAQNLSFTATPEDIGPMVNSWVGRTEGGNANFNGGVNELRTYNGELSPLQIQLNYTAGSDSFISSPGALVPPMTFTVFNNSVLEGDVQSITVMGNFASIPNINMTTVATLSSSAPSIATVDAFGVVRALRPGTTTISAVYQGTTNTALLTVLAKPLVMTHRYSFNDPDGSTLAADSLAPGTGDASLGGSAAIASGQVWFDGVNGANNATYPYVQLPNNLFTEYSSMTIETWFTADNAGGWSRVWDFGNNTTLNFFLTLSAAANPRDARVAITTSGSGGEQQVNFRSPKQGAEHHVVYTHDFANNLGRVYVNGVLVATNNNITLRPRDINPMTVTRLGRSVYGDNAFRGSINELRIWEGAISPAQVALSYGLGPNATTAVTAPGAPTSVSVALSAATAGQVQQARLPVNFAAVANVNLAPFASNWVSSDSTVAKVDQTGLVTAVGAGSATISATYGGTTGNGAVTVSAATAPALAHRYSFTGNANDSAGTANGTLAAGATINGGKAVLTGATDSYVTLPGNLMDGFAAVTIEAWSTFSMTTNVGFRLWSYGDSGKTNWISFSPRSSNNNGSNTRLHYNLAYTNSGPTGGTLGEINLDSRGNPVGTNSGTTNVHYVVVINPPLEKAELYINGLLYETFDWAGPAKGNTTPILLSKLGNAQGYLGRPVQTNGTPPLNYVGSIDEFRIWNGALNKAQVAANYAAGPDSPVTNPGAPTAIAMSLSDPKAVLGTTQRPTIWGTFAGGTFDITESTGVGLSSDNSAIVLVDGNRLRAVGTGTANVTARFGGKTDTKAVTVGAKQLTMTHRYSFTSDASDSVGGAHGVLKGNAVIAGGVVNLNASVTPLTYVDLPADLVSGYDVVTFECFFNVTNAANNRLFEFGDYSYLGNQGVDYLSYTPNQSRAFTQAPNPVRNGTLAVGGEAEGSATAAPVSGQTHVVVVMNEQAKTITYYTNGALAVNITNANVNVSTIVNAKSYLGRSVYLNDPTLNGSINEFRIYYGAMSASEVATSFAAGPDNIPSASPTLNFARSGNNIVLSWTDSSFSLAAAGAVSQTFTNVPGATSPYTNSPTLPELYFRLRK